MTNPLDDICYIHLDPASLGRSRSGGDGDAGSPFVFDADASIPLPVRRDGANGGEGEDSEGEISIDSITVESVLSGILTIAAHDVHNKNLDYYRRLLLSSRPNIKKELTEAAILCARNEEWDDADEMFLSLMGLFGEDTSVVLNRALFLDQRASSYRRSMLDEDADALDEQALSLYKKAMDSTDPPPDAFFNAGFFYMKSHSYSEAKGCFETYVALTSDASDEELGEGGIYKRERAQEIVNYIRNQGVDDEHFQKAYSLISGGHEEEGMEEVRLFLQSNPKVWNAWFLLGWALRRLARYGEAKESFEKALELARTDGARGDDWKDALCNTYNELAICLMECGSIQDAKGALLKALSIDSENPKVMSNLGFVSLKEGKKDEARGYFLAALEYDKNDKIAMHALKSLEE